MRDDFANNPEYSKAHAVRDYLGLSIDEEIEKLSWSKVYADGYEESMKFDEFYYDVVPVIKRIKEL